MVVERMIRFSLKDVSYCLLGVDLTGNSVASLAASLEAVEGGSLLDPAVVLAWATRQPRRAQLVLCLTGSNTVVDRNEVGSVFI